MGEKSESQNSVRKKIQSKGKKLKKYLIKQLK